MASNCSRRMTTLGRRSAKHLGLSRLLCRRRCVVVNCPLTSCGTASLSIPKTCQLSTSCGTTGYTSLKQSCVCRSLPICQRARTALVVVGNDSVQLRKVNDRNTESLAVIPEMSGEETSSLESRSQASQPQHYGQQSGGSGAH